MNLILTHLTGKQKTKLYEEAEDMFHVMEEMEEYLSRKKHVTLDETNLLIKMNSFLNQIREEGTVSIMSRL